MKVVAGLLLVVVIVVAVNAVLQRNDLAQQRSQQKSTMKVLNGGYSS